MEFDDLVRDYIKTRNGFALRIQEISQQMTAWTSLHSSTPPALKDVAQFEGLRAERSRLLAEFTEYEDQFVVAMLRRVSSQ